MQIRIRANAGPVARALQKNEKQAKYALAKAINATALGAQAEVRANMRHVFTLRRAAFFDRAIKIKPFATRERPSADLQIDPQLKRRDIIIQHEEGRVKRATSGKGVAIPVEAARGRTGVVYNRNRPSQLGLKPGKGGNRNVMRGDRRTVLIRSSSGRGALYQRVGRKKSSRLKMLYKWAEQGKIAPRLGFKRTTERAVKAKFAGHFKREFAAALATART
jgi:hypothetical protein